MKRIDWALSDALSVKADMMELTESPIEASMLTGLLANQRFTRSEFTLSGRGIVRGTYPLFFVDLDDVTALVVPQLRVTRFRLDLGIILQRGDRRVYAAVECDGHNFHSHPDDVKRDKIRDRELAQAGWLVCRFPGTEIAAADVTTGGMTWKFLTSLARAWCREDHEFSMSLPGGHP